MRDKSNFTIILEEKTIKLRGIDVVVSLVMTKTARSRDLVRTYSNFLKNDSNKDKIQELKHKGKKAKIIIRKEKND